MLNKDTQEPIETPNNRAMDDDGPGSSLLARFFGGVFHVEVYWCLVIQLDSATLQFSFESVSNCDIDLGAIECPITGVHGPFIAIEPG
jgi:hypothetical protein